MNLNLLEAENYDKELRILKLLLRFHSVLIFAACVLRKKIFPLLFSSSRLRIHKIHSLTFCPSSGHFSARVLYPPTPPPPPLDLSHLFLLSHPTYLAASFSSSSPSFLIIIITTFTITIITSASSSYLHIYLFFPFSLRPTLFKATNYLFNLIISYSSNQAKLALFFLIICEHTLFPLLSSCGHTLKPLFPHTHTHIRKPASFHSKHNIIYFFRSHFVISSPSLMFIISVATLRTGPSLKFFSFHPFFRLGEDATLGLIEGWSAIC